MNSNAPIKLIHGWGMNRQVWTDFLEQVPPDLKARITALDLPGYGENNFMPVPYDLPQLANWLAEQITEPTHVVGWSLGGLVALECAKRFPQKVSSVGLVASSPKFLADDNWSGIQPTVLEGFATSLQSDHEKTVGQFLKIQAMGSPHLKQDIKRLKERLMSLPSPNVNALSEGLMLLKTIDLRSDLDKIDMPIKAIFGEQDSLVPSQTAADVMDLHAKIDVTVLKKCSHAPFISNPDEFLHWMVKSF